MKEKRGFVFIGITIGMLIVLLVIVAMALIICICRPDIKNRILDVIDGTEAGYNIAIYDKYNSPAEENGLKGAYIYIVADKLEQGTVNGQTYIKASTSDGDWLLMSNFFSEATIEDIINDSTGKNIKVYGSYLGYSDVLKCPSMAIDRIVIDDIVYAPNINISAS